MTALMIMLSTSVFSQKTVTWIGGTPGHENDWNYARNWSNNTVPDNFSNVIIPDVSTTTFSSPIITSGKIEVNTLFIETTAHLTIAEAGELVILEDAVGISRRNLRVYGRLLLPDTVPGNSDPTNVTARY
jgi:hypothetical protein